MFDPTLGDAYLESIRLRFEGYRSMGRKAIEQMEESDFVWQSCDESNSVAQIVQHMRGNMLSRWTDIFTTDGEKPNRNRDSEFVLPESMTRAEVVALWDEGWDCLFAAINALGPEDLLSHVKIRGQSLSVLDAINRQAMHVPYHIGQIVHIVRERRGANWETLSIPRGTSAEYIPGSRD